MKNVQESNSKGIKIAKHKKNISQIVNTVRMAALKLFNELESAMKEKIQLQNL